jgi:hypothetical protein
MDTYSTRNPQQGRQPRTQRRQPRPAGRRVGTRVGILRAALAEG